ncbi:MAG TPA: hypothetical protein VD763_00155 [Candidatus Saccharimonadales bacterium]|nr:hypothetical protein [Candidatus Saccharimonadales bacterium]
MIPKRLLAPALLLVAFGVAACGTTGGSGTTTSSAPSAAASAAASAAPSTDASGAPSGDASAAPSGDASAAPSGDASAAPSASGATGGGDLASRIPATVGDVTLTGTTVDAESYIRSNVNRQLTPIVAALGKAPTDVTVATSSGAAAGGQTLFLDAVQIAGADTAAAQEAFQTAAAAVPGSEVATADIGGKQVVTVTTPSYTLAVFGIGDTIFYVQSPDADLVEQAITAIQ